MGDERRGGRTDRPRAQQKDSLAQRDKRLEVEFGLVGSNRYVSSLMLGLSGGGASGRA